MDDDHGFLSKLSEKERELLDGIPDDISESIEKFVLYMRARDCNIMVLISCDGKEHHVSGAIGHGHPIVMAPIVATMLHAFPSMSVMVNALREAIDGSAEGN